MKINIFFRFSEQDPIGLWKLFIRPSKHHSAKSGYNWLSCYTQEEYFHPNLFLIIAASASREVAIQNGKLEVQETKTQLEPYFAIDGNILKVSYLNFDGQDMSLHIFEGDNQVYESGLGNPFVVQKGLNVSDLNNGSYQVVLATENEVYSYDLGR